MLTLILTFVLMPVLVFLELTIYRWVFMNSGEEIDPEWELYQQRYDQSRARHRSLDIPKAGCYVVPFSAKAFLAGHYYSHRALSLALIEGVTAPANNAELVFLPVKQQQRHQQDHSVKQIQSTVYNDADVDVLFPGNRILNWKKRQNPIKIPPG